MRAVLRNLIPFILWTVERFIGGCDFVCIYLLSCFMFFFFTRCFYNVFRKSNGCDKHFYDKETTIASLEDDDCVSCSYTLIVICIDVSILIDRGVQLYEHELSIFWTSYKVDMNFLKLSFGLIKDDFHFLFQPFWFK